MKRKTKNIICIIGILIGIAIISTTIILAKNNLASSNGVLINENGGGNRPAMPNDGNMQGQPPELPDGQTPNMDGNEPPQEKNNQNNESSDSTTTKSKKSKKSDNQTNDSSTSSSSDSNKMNKGQRPSMEESFVKKDSVVKLTAWYIIAISCGALILSVSLSYLILSLFGKKDIFTKGDKIIIYILTTVIFTAGITFGLVTFTNNNILLTKTADSIKSSIKKDNNSSSNANVKGKKEVTTTETLKDSYSSTESDENSILVKNGSTATIDGANIEKSGDSNNSETADFYGTNAAIMTTDNSKTIIKNSTISTNAKGANAVFSYSTGTVEISDSKITTTGSNSGALMVTGGGTLTANNVTAETSGNSAAPIRSDRGGGTLTVNKGTYTSHGTGSPVIYSTADITVNDAKLTATSSEGVVVEGKNSVTLNNVDMEVTNTKLNGNSQTYKSIFIYQSMSGDADVGTSKFTAKDSKIVNNKGDIIFVTNTSTQINLENNEIINNDKNGVFLRVSAAKWGTSGSNGGDVILNMTNQKVSGDIVIDNISTLEYNLTKSTYTGSINNKNTAKSIKVSLSKDSKWTLTSDSYITELNDKDSTYSNIDLNGYKLYVNGKELKK